MLEKLGRQSNNQIIRFGFNYVFKLSNIFSSHEVGCSNWCQLIFWSNELVFQPKILKKKFVENFRSGLIWFNLGQLKFLVYFQVGVGNMWVGSDRAFSETKWVGPGRPINSPF